MHVLYSPREGKFVPFSPEEKTLTLPRGFKPVGDQSLIILRNTANKIPQAPIELPLTRAQHWMASRNRISLVGLLEGFNRRAVKETGRGLDLSGAIILGGAAVAEFPGVTVTGADLRPFRTYSAAILGR